MADKEDLVKRVKQWQRLSEEHKEAWSNHCARHGYVDYDPNRHTSAFLIDFLRFAEAGTQAQSSNSGGGSWQGGSDGSDGSWAGKKRTVGDVGSSWQGNSDNSGSWNEGWKTNQNDDSDAADKPAAATPVAGDSASETDLAMLAQLHALYSTEEGQRQLALYQAMMTNSGAMAGAATATATASPAPAAAPKAASAANVTDKDKPALVERIKQYQRMGEEHREAWWEYCTSHGSVKHDPNRHGVRFLAQFLACAESGTIPGIPPPKKPRKALVKPQLDNPSCKLFVGGLLKSTNEETVRAYFSAFGIVSEVQFKYTPEGDFRGFAFVTFAQIESAMAVMGNYENNMLEGHFIECKYAEESRKGGGKGWDWGDGANKTGRWDWWKGDGEKTNGNQDQAADSSAAAEPVAGDSAFQTNFAMLAQLQALYATSEGQRSQDQAAASAATEVGERSSGAVAVGEFYGGSVPTAEDAAPATTAAVDGNGRTDKAAVDSESTCDYDWANPDLVAHLETLASKVAMGGGDNATCELVQKMAASYKAYRSKSP